LYLRKLQGEGVHFADCEVTNALWFEVLLIQTAICFAALQSSPVMEKEGVDLQQLLQQVLLQPPPLLLVGQVDSSLELTRTWTQNWLLHSGFLWRKKEHDRRQLLEEHQMTLQSLYLRVGKHHLKVQMLP
jgi:hypothetical protein